MPLMPLLGTWSPGGCCDPRPRADPSSLLSPRPLFVQMLSERLIPFVALDVSASRVQDGKRLDLPVYFGDAGSPAVLHAVGADKAACAVRRRDVPARLPTRPPTYLLDTPPSPPRQCTPHPPGGGVKEAHAETGDPLVSMLKVCRSLPAPRRAHTGARSRRAAFFSCLSLTHPCGRC